MLHVNGTNLNYAPLTEMTFGAFVSLPFNLTDTKALDERTTVRGTVDARLVQDFISPHEKDTAGPSSLRQPQAANTCPVPTGPVDSKNWTASFGEISADSANQGQGDVNESETVIPVQAKTDRQDYYRVYQGKQTKRLISTATLVSLSGRPSELMRQCLVRIEF